MHYRDGAVNSWDDTTLYSLVWNCSGADTRKHSDIGYQETLCFQFNSRKCSGQLFPDMMAKEVIIPVKFYIHHNSIHLSQPSFNILIKHKLTAGHFRVCNRLTCFISPKRRIFICFTNTLGNNCPGNFLGLNRMSWVPGKCLILREYHFKYFQK